MFPHIQYGDGGGCEMMIRAIGVVFFLLLVSGCCVVDTFTYEPTFEEQMKREKDIWSIRRIHPELDFQTSPTFLPD